jgi:tRNA(fMet)-specific endonuclease VapC
MNFLLDTDTCSYYLKNDPKVVARVMLHYGSLAVSVITVGELLTWAMRANAPRRRIDGVRDLVAGFSIVEVSLPVVEKFGEIRAELLDQGLSRSPMDLLNAAIALVHNLTLVTHNVQDYAGIPNLTIDDWAIP